MISALQDICTRLTLVEDDKYEEYEKREPKLVHTAFVRLTRGAELNLTDVGQRRTASRVAA